MKIESLKETCTGCTACKTVCPKRCIQIVTDEEGFYYPCIDKNICIQCGMCETVCHCIISQEELNNEHHSYYGASLNDDVLDSSSSGGVFYHLAQKILDENGVVFGAAFDYAKRLLKHTSTDVTSIQEIQKSKYIESYLGDTLNDIQNALREKRKVLFCGTPCQVSGVKRAIRDPEGLLLTCDFICHGVPSARLFKEHLSHIIGKNEELISLDFRPKDLPWASKNIRIRTRTRTRTRPYRFDAYYYGFMNKNAYLRRCCYNCQFRKRHLSDITIADFWGWSKYKPNLNTQRGLSLIIANNEKGEKAVCAMKDFDLHALDNKYSDYVYAPRDYSEARKFRNKFFELEKKYGFEKAAIMTYMRGARKAYLIYRIKSLIKAILGRL